MIKLREKPCLLFLLIVLLAKITLLNVIVTKNSKILKLYILIFVIVVVE